MKANGRFGVAVLLFLVLVVGQSCSGGSGNNNTVDPEVNSIDGISFFPPDGSFVAAWDGIGLQLTDNNTDGASAVYSITLYRNPEMTDVVDMGENLSADGSGQVNWSYNRRLGDNKAFYWTFAAEYPDNGIDAPTDATSLSKTVQSGLLQFKIPQKGSLQAISPRNGGYMDVNHTGAPILAVVNYYNGDDVEISYDFELAVNPEMTNIVSMISGLPQNSQQTYTDWYADPSSFPGQSDEFAAEGLIEGRRYYWRSQMLLNGQPQGWSALRSFDVLNLCQIRGPLHATRVISSITQRVCDVLINTNPNAALGTPNAGGYVDNQHPGGGYISIDFGGELIVEMGRPILNGPGDDVRIFEFVSFENMEVFAGNSEIGPWHSLGSQFCGESCDFDLSAGRVPYAKYIKINDLSSPFGRCHETSGVDIDAVITLHGVYSDRQCG